MFSALFRLTFLENKNAKMQPVGSSEIRAEGDSGPCSGRARLGGHGGSCAGSSDGSWDAALPGARGGRGLETALGDTWVWPAPCPWACLVLN